jgi:hypothetical protein
MKIMNKKMDLSGVDKKIDTNVEHARELYKKDADEKKARELSAAAEKKSRDMSTDAAAKKKADEIAK